MAHYAALYDQYQCYGGPEEGGWYYDRHFPRKVYKGKKRIAKKWFKRFKTTAAEENAARKYGYTSVLGGEWAWAGLEKRKPKTTPRAYYC